MYSMDTHKPGHLTHMIIERILSSGRTLGECLCGTESITLHAHTKVYKYASTSSIVVINILIVSF